MYVPRLFDRDASACAAWYSSLESKAWATAMADAWSGVTDFCSAHGPTDDTMSTEFPIYFANQVALATPTIVPRDDAGVDSSADDQSCKSGVGIVKTGFALVWHPLTALLGVEVVANVEQVLTGVFWLLIYFLEM